MEGNSTGRRAVARCESKLDRKQKHQSLIKLSSVREMEKKREKNGAHAKLVYGGRALKI